MKLKLLLKGIAIVCISGVLQSHTVKKEHIYVTNAVVNSSLDKALNLASKNAVLDLKEWTAVRFNPAIVPDANNILYVSKTATGNSSGNSWANAIPELADALVWAQNNKADFTSTPLQIWVAGGTYKPLYSPVDGVNFGTDKTRENTFLMVNNVQLYGGFAGTETTLANRDLSLTANKSSLSGDFSEDDTITGANSTLTIKNNTENAYRVVISAGDVGTARLDGFTITGGNFNPFYFDETINGQDVIGSYGGGGMLNYKSSPIIANCSFIRNAAEDNQLIEVGLGGGGFLNNQGSPTIVNCLFTQNKYLPIYGGSAGFGGGMSSSDGSPKLINSTFFGNSTGTFDYNVPQLYVSGGNLKIYNSIVWGIEYNIPGFKYENLTEIDIQNNLIHENFSGNGNINATGLIDTNIFNDPANGDYSLKPLGIAVNAGSNTLYNNAGGNLTTDKDLAGNPRVFQNTIDLGAYESQIPILTPDANNILYVSKTATGNSSGNSWANAIPELADALVWAQNNKADFTTTPLQIWVAGGTYKPLYSPEDGANFGTDQTRENAFLMVNNVQLYGGFTGTETTLADRNLSITANKTVLSGDFNGDDTISGSGSTLSISNNGENAGHVVISAGNVGTARLDGFTISGGNANGHNTFIVNNIVISGYYGGGMYTSSSSPAITNTIISGNATITYGGGMYTSSSSPAITNTIISGNTTDYFGGGMYNTFSSPAITNTIIIGNTATTDSGGGMYNTFSSPTITNSTFSGNTAISYGGGIFNDNSSPTITNSTFSGNTAIFNGGGIFNYDSSPKVNNSIIIGATFNGGSSNPIYKNSIIADKSYDNTGTAITTNLTTTDLFNDPTNGDYSLNGFGQALNAGNNTLYTGTIATDKDLAGNARLFAGIPDPDVIDLGAYEYQGEPLKITATDGVLYVNKTATGNKTGDSWANAIPELADALVWAQNNKANFTTTPLQIWVAKGTYKPMYSPEDGANFGTDQTRDNTFLLVNNVELYGGFAGTEATLVDRDLSLIANTTILSGDLATVNDNTDNTYHVVVSAGEVGSAKLDGFNLIEGNANDDSFGSITVNTKTIARYYGGGMFNIESSPSLTNVKLTGNTASYGGGIYNYSNSNTILTNVSLSGNTATYEGGGMVNSNSDPILTNVSLSRNTTTSNGGGMFNSNSDPILTNVSLSGNTASSGGGMYNYDSSATLTNTILLGNSASTRDAGIYNGGSVSGSGSGSISITYSLVQGQTNASNGNIDATGVTDTDLFNDPANGDYSLKAGSIAINAGNNTLYTDAGGSLTTDKDLGGNKRVFQSTIDIGAYESQKAIITPDANNILYVNKTATGEAIGGSWANAIPELADALVWANNNKADFTTKPLQIWIAGGTYKPLYSPRDGANFVDETKDNAFLMVNNVQLYGGFAGTESILAERDLSITANKTTLSGDIGVANDDTDNTNNVVVSFGAVGTAHLDGFTVSSGRANDTRTFSINNTDIRRFVGGGMFNRNSSPTIINTIFIGNMAKFAGGGMYNLNSSPTITNTTFIDNSIISTDGKGGGMFNNSSSSPIITNTTFSGNSATDGSGMANQDNSNAIVNNTIVTGTISNYNATPLYRNSVIADKSYDSDGSETTTNLTVTALFNDPTNGDYSLKEGSVVVNFGNNTLYTDVGGDLSVGKDLAGSPRVFQSTIDIGAYESQVVKITPDENNILYVNKASTGEANGNSWANAVPELADALVWAKQNEKTTWATTPLKIFVAKGTYKPLYTPEDGTYFGTDQGRNNSFLMVNNVQLYGGFDPANGIDDLSDSRILPNSGNSGTLLSGDVNDDDGIDFSNNSENLVRVMVSSGNLGEASLNGFTISGANGENNSTITVNGNPIYQCSGAGVYNSISSPLYENILLEGNYNTESGGVCLTTNHRQAFRILFLKTTKPKMAVVWPTKIILHLPY